MNVQTKLGTILGLMLVLPAATGWAEFAVRSAQHEDYAKELWVFLQTAKYQQWPAVTPDADFTVGPPSDRSAKHFSRQTSEDARQQAGTVIVTEHYASDPPVLAAVTVRLKRQPGYNARHDDWYWVHFTADGRTVETAADKNPWAKRGFVTFEEEGRLWVFEANCLELSKYLKDGELAKHVVLPVAGPAGKTLKGPDAETLDRYVVAKPGFVTRLEDGRAWVFRQGATELAQFEQQGELAKHVVRPGAGPRGMTLKAPDAETLDEYLCSKPEFVVRMEDGRAWVFKKGAPELAQFEKDGELAKHVVRPGAGPGGLTMKAPDAETLDAYLVAQPGFVTKVDDGRVWVFRQGAPEWNEFQEKGELAKHVIRPSAGPGGMTVRAPDADTLDAYLRACGL